MNLLLQVSEHNVPCHNGIFGLQTTDSPTIRGIKISLTQFIHGYCWCAGFPLLWHSIVKSPAHHRDSSLFGSLSKHRMDTGIRPGKRERSAGKMLLWDFTSVAFKLLRSVNQPFTEYSDLIPLQKAGKAHEMMKTCITSNVCHFCDLNRFCYWCEGSPVGLGTKTHINLKSKLPFAWKIEWKQVKA